MTPDGGRKREMGFRRYTRQEVKSIRQAVARFREDYPNWRKIYKSQDKLEYVKSVMKELGSDRKPIQVKVIFNEILKGPIASRPQRLHWPMAGRTRIITEKGRQSLRENGKRQWEQIKERLRAEGLTNEQIDRAFSRKTVKLSPDNILYLNSKLINTRSLLVRFIVRDDLSVQIFSAQESNPAEPEASLPRTEPASV